MLNLFRYQHMPLMTVTTAGTGGTGGGAGGAGGGTGGAGGTGGTGGGGTGTGTGTAAAATQITTKEGLLSFINKLLDTGTAVLYNTMDTINKGIEAIGGNIYMNMEKMQIETARAMGMSYETSAKLFSAYSVLNRTGMGTVFGMNQAKLFETQRNVGKATGRNIGINEETGWNIGAMNTLIGDEATIDLIGKLDIYGQNATDAAEYIGEIYKKAGKYGLSFEEYAEKFRENLELAQKYNFKDGLKGVSEMAKKATELKLSMNQVASFADKMWDKGIEGAIESAASLQVLGGPFAAMADPLAILNESLNDLGGLSDRVVGMVGNMGRFNRETGEVEIDSANLWRLREASNAMGMNYEELLKTVRTNERRNAVEEELKYYGGFDENITEKLKNIGTFKGGRAGATINGEFKYLDEIAASRKLQEELLHEGVSQEENVKDIAKNVRTMTQKIEFAKAGQEGGIAEMQEGFMTYISSLIDKLGPVLTNTIFNAFGAGIKVTQGTVNMATGILNWGSPAKTSGNGGPVPSFGDGGLVSGPSHAEGGIMAAIHNTPAINLEGGEFIVNKESASQYGNVLSTINNANKPYSNMPSPSGLYGNGGYLATTPQAEFSIGPGIVGSIAARSFSISPIETESSRISSTEHNMTYEKVAYNQETNNYRNYNSADASKEVKVGGELTLNIKGDNVKNDKLQLDFVNDVWKKLSPAQQYSIVHDVFEISKGLKNGIGS